MEISFPFNSEKTVEAAAMFLKLHGKPMKYIALLKMLYIITDCLTIRIA